jgi:hypothetical protein
MELELSHGRPHGRPQSSSIFFVRQPKWMCTTFLLSFPVSILFKTNSGFRGILFFKQTRILILPDSSHTPI